MRSEVPYLRKFAYDAVPFVVCPLRELYCSDMRFGAQMPRRVSCSKSTVMMANVPRPDGQVTRRLVRSTVAAGPPRSGPRTPRQAIEAIPAVGHRTAIDRQRVPHEHQFLLVGLVGDDAAQTR